MAHENIKNYVLSLGQNDKQLREELDAYIDDKNEPLEERFKIFCRAPGRLYNHYTDTPYLKALPDNWIMYDGGLHADRYQRFDAQDIVDTAEAYNKIDGYQKSCYAKYRETHPTIDVEALIEEILEERIHNFTHNW